MKRPKAFTIMNFILQRALFFIVLLVLWNVCFPDILRSMEETAFWADAPDTTNVMYHWPADWAAIASNYLVQYFQIGFIGAVIMAILPMVMLLASDVNIWQFLRNRRMQWLAFIPAAITALLLSHDTTLARYLQIDAIAVAAALVVFILTFKNKKLRLDYHSRWFLIVGNVMPYIIIIATAIIMKSDATLQAREYNSLIEHLAEDRHWDELIDITYSNRHHLDDSQIAYSLLAQSRKGQLANRLFHYPVKGLDNIFAHSKNFRFNSFFCHEFGLPNEAIRYAFEEGQYMPAGASFGTMRRMVDWLLEKGDDPEMADFYLNLLSHSSCHDNFIATRRMFMGQQQLKKEEVKPEFVGSPSFLYEAALILEREPNNIYARDYLLCGMLLIGNTDAFYNLFERIFVETNDSSIPEHYYEALLVARNSHPQIDSSYNIPVKIEAAYRTFLNLVGQGETGKMQAFEKYQNTYWTYLLRSGKSPTNPTAQEIPLTQATILGPEFGY